MNNQFDEMAKGLARSVTRCGARKKFSLAGIALTSLLAAHASDFRAGPISDLSDPDVFAGCGSNGSEKECSIAVNPTNSKNLVTAWIGGRFRGIGAAVSFDGGKRWQQVIIPGLSACQGGGEAFPFNDVGDPWLSFGPGGGLFIIIVASDTRDPKAIRKAALVSKSVDGGMNWVGPVALSDTTDQRFFPDYPRITADPTDARFVYAVWNTDDNGNRGAGILSRRPQLGGGAGNSRSGRGRQCHSWPYYQCLAGRSAGGRFQRIQIRG